MDQDPEEKQMEHTVDAAAYFALRLGAAIGLPNGVDACFSVDAGLTCDVGAG